MTSPGRSLVRQLAVTLPVRRCPCQVVACWLDAAGYAPSTQPGHFARSDVLKHLREARAEPSMLTPEPFANPAALK